MSEPGAPRLYDMAMRGALKNAKRYIGMGDLDIRFAQPVLEKVATAEQLHMIERNSPHLIGDLDEHWERIIQRTIPEGVRRKYASYAPEDPKFWFRQYKKLQMLGEQDALDAKQRMAKAMMAAKKEKQSTFVQTVRGIPPSHAKRGHAAAPPPRKQKDQGKELLHKIRSDMNKVHKKVPAIKTSARRVIHDPRVVSKAPIHMMRDYGMEESKIKKQSMAAPRPASRPAPTREPPSRPSASKPSATSSQVHVAERRRISDLSPANVSSDCGPPPPPPASKRKAAMGSKTKSLEDLIFMKSAKRHRVR